MQCNRCGATLPPGASICPNCGNPTPYNVSSQGGSSYDPTVAAPPPYGTPPGGTPPPPTGYGTTPYGAPAQNPYEQAQQGPYGAPSAQPYGTPPPQPYGAPQPSPYGTFPQGPQQTPPRKRSRVGLIIGIVIVVILLACTIGGVLLVRGVTNVAQNVVASATNSIASATAAPTNAPTAAPTSAPTTAPTQGTSPSGSPIVPSAAAIVSNPQMASAVDSNYLPTKLTNTFGLNQPIYVTFRLNLNGQSGYVESKWYIDGVFGRSDKLTVTPNYDHGYFSISYKVAAHGAVELYWCTQSDCSDAQLAQASSFTVSASASTHTTGQPALAMLDMDRRV